MIGFQSLSDSPLRNTDSAVLPPGEERRNVWRVFYAPYAWLIFIPMFGLLTSLLGAIGIAVAKFSTRLSEWAGVAWGRGVCLLNFTPVRVKGREHVQPEQSYVILANHQSHFDIFTVYGHLNIPFRWVMKEELRKAPFIGWYTSAAGHVFVDRSNQEKARASLETAKARLANGLSVFFFPEGTRSLDGRLTPFKKGGFHTALDLGLPILPVSISGTWKVLPCKTFKLLPGNPTITIHPPIDTTRFNLDRMDELVAQARAAIGKGLTDWERNEM
jgi:1-acyl-sn-glycerol-3-phosphate acyltransferase